MYNFIAFSKVGLLICYLCVHAAVYRVVCCVCYYSAELHVSSDLVFISSLSEIC